MADTYKAILRKDHLEWRERVPRSVEEGYPLSVQVTILDEPTASATAQGRGQRMVSALERLVTLGAVSEIQDPVEWQRELRQDRALPDRKE